MLCEDVQGGAAGREARQAGSLPKSRRGRQLWSLGTAGTSGLNPARVSKTPFLSTSVCTCVYRGVRRWGVETCVCKSVGRMITTLVDLWFVWGNIKQDHNITEPQRTWRVCPFGLRQGPDASTLHGSAGEWRLLPTCLILGHSRAFLKAVMVFCLFFSFLIVIKYIHIKLSIFIFF